ncbi:MAG: type II toxin-antitoxin system RelE family toxin [Candidatus Nanoarchaeia archaeon]
MMRVQFTEEFKKKLTDLKDKKLQETIHKHLIKIENNPELGKPLQHDLKSYRSVRISSFRIIYKLENDFILFIYFDKRKSVYEKLAKYINYNHF